MYNRSQYPRIRGAGGGTAGAGAAANSASHGRAGSSSSSNTSASTKYSNPIPDPSHVRLPGSAAASPCQDKYERFESWLRENGAEFELLELREYDCPPTEATSRSTSMSSSSSTSASRVASPSHRSMIKSSRAAACYALDEEKKEALSEAAFSDDSASAMSEMRGVHARRHIPPNTVCMSVPRQCLITVEMGQATPIGQAILQSDLDLDAPKHIFLMIFLLWDRKVNGVHSFFHPYYEILPPTLSNMPIFWSDDELEALRGSYLLQQIADRNAAIQEDYNAICQIARLEQICTLDEFKWARMCVCSRNFGLQMDGHRTSALVPHADMLNHYRPRETKWTFDEDRQAFTITSLQHISAGSQVYDSYGQKCNHRFLLNYGFAVEDNRELDGFCPNEVPVELYVDPDDELFQEKLDYWTRGESNSSPTSTAYTSASPWSGPPAAAHAQSSSGVATSFAAATPVVKRVRVCVSNNENTRLLFSLLRVLACNREELHVIASDVGRLGMSLATDMSVSKQNEPPYSSTSLLPMFSSNGGGAYAYQASSSRSCRDIRHPISVSNETAAMHLLLDVVQRHLNRYPTTLDQDDLDLLDLRLFPRFSNARHAKIQVRGEKVVLHHFADWARTSLQVLSVLQEELNALGGSGGSGDPSRRIRRTEQDEVEDNGVEVQLAQPGSSSTVRNGTSLGRGHASAESSARHLIVLEPGPASSHSRATSGSGSTGVAALPSYSGLPSRLQQAAAAELATDKFERLIRQLEDACDANSNDESEGIHHTIVRYCADVLGSLRREEIKILKRRQSDRTHVSPPPGTSSASPSSPFRYHRGSGGGPGGSIRPGAAYL